ncbi:bifunctional 5,10-methylenetetrahydrofolate dehydrogenase/5,10-methenyltetrahydrofolate cyclohydrolase [Patescibacteria group bacterium]
MIVDGNKIAEKIYAGLRTEIRYLRSQGVAPTLAVVLIGEDKYSRIYVRNKQIQAKKLGVRFILKKFSSKAVEEKILDCLCALSQDFKINGIIIQLPLPDKFNTDKILNALDLQKDIDNLTGNSRFLPPTPMAILKILEEYKISFHNKKILLIGRGKLVGRPLANILSSKGIEYEMIGRDTVDLKEKTLNADIIISSTGQDNLLTADMIKSQSVVIDAANDIQFAEVSQKAILVTPPKGGIGPLTIAYLLKNTVQAAQIQSNSI